MTAPPWLVLTLACALAWSTVDAVAKKALGRHSPETLFLVRWGYALPVVAAAALLSPRPEFGPRFWPAILVGVPFEVAAGLLYLHAIRLSPLSLTVPLLAWTPVFSALFSWAVLGEVPSLSGGAGIALVTVGSYLLAFHGGGGLLDPFRFLAREKGCRMMLATALIYSGTSALGKVGVMNSSPLYFAAVYSFAVTAVAVTLAALRRGAALAAAAAPQRIFLALGFAAGAMIILHFTAIELTKVAYMISVKRTSLLISVLFGGLFFHEARTARRFAGAAVMFSGLVLLSFQA